MMMAKEERQIWASVKQYDKIRGASTISGSHSVTVLVTKRGSLQLVARVMLEVALVDINSDL